MRSQIDDNGVSHPLGGFITPDGIFHPRGEPCDFEVGAVFRIGVAGPPAERQTPVPPTASRGARMDPQPEAATPEHAPEHAPEAVPEHLPEHVPDHASDPAPAHARTHASAGLPAGDGPDFSGALGAAEALGDSPYAPFVLLAIAALTVLGGKKAWEFWGERSARQHELELRKLDIQAQQAGLQGAQPPPCQAKQAENEARLSALEEAVKEVRQATGGLGGFDPEVVEDIDKRLKRVERAEKARRDEERDEERRERKA